MKSIWKKIGLALIALTISSQAMALILIEPYVGYDFSLNGEAGSSKFDFSGLGYGGRLGIQLTTIMFGVSYDIMDLDIEPEGGGKFGYEQTNLGVFVGWNPKLDGIRFWGTYFIDSDGDADGSTTKDSGDGFGIGFGYKFKPWLALNAEYRTFSYDEPAGTDMKLDSIFISLSFPFDIL